MLSDLSIEDCRGKMPTFPLFHYGKEGGNVSSIDCEGIIFSLIDLFSYCLNKFVSKCTVSLKSLLLGFQVPFDM